jgi:hypothetical protein
MKGLMIEETHIRLAKELSKVLSLDINQSKLLEKGCVYPDYQESFPHHIGKEKEIADLLRKARITFQNGDDECYFLLGMAFHFMQDKWTLRARSRDKHTKWEDMINKTDILDEEALVERIQDSPLPTKFKEAYIAFIDLLENEIESPSFWRKYVDMDGYIEFIPFWDRLLERQKETEERLKTIVKTEAQEGLGKRILLLAIRAWATDEPPRVISFRNLFPKNQDFSFAGKIAEVTRYTTPEIDLNVAFILCREVGKKVLSHEFRWAEKLDSF